MDDREASGRASMWRHDAEARADGPHDTEEYLRGILFRLLAIEAQLIGED